MNQNNDQKNKIKIFAKNRFISILKSEFSYFKKDPYFIMIIILFILFSIYFSYNSILKFYALSAPSTLGMIMEEGWWFITNYSLEYLIIHPIILIISPLFILKSYIVLLSFETIFITIGIFPAYGIAKHLVKSRLLSFIFAISYLTFPYIAGKYYFDFLYQSMFPTLFLFGYYFYLKNRFKISFIFFILSGITFFPYFIFLGIFSLVILILNIYRKKWSKENYNRKNKTFSIVIFVTTITLFLVLNYVLLLNSLGMSGNLSAYLPKNGHLLYNIYYKINLLFLLFLPLIALSLLTRRFIFMFFPLFYVLLFFIITSSLIPLIWGVQFLPLIIAYIFLGLIFSIYCLIERYKTFEKIDHKIKYIFTILIHSIDLQRIPNEKVHTRKIQINISVPKLRITVFMLVLVIVFAIISQPIDPFNQYSQQNLDLFENTSANYTAFNALQKVISFIPNNDPYVLTQNNLPELYPRSLPYGVPLITGITNFTLNVTTGEIYINNSGKLISPKIDYILSDLNSPWYIFGNPNMYEFNSLLYTSGKYGIVAEASGFVLLEKGYKGSIKYYEPEYISFKPSSMLLGSNSTVYKNIIMANNTNSTMLWSTHSFNLAPGKYNITFSIKTNNTSLKNVLLINVSAFAVSVLTKYCLNGLTLKTQNNWINISFSLDIYSFFENITISCYSMHWSGTLYFKNITISQKSIQPFLVIKNLMYVNYEKTNITKLKFFSSDISFFIILLEMQNKINSINNILMQEIIKSTKKN